MQKPIYKPQLLMWSLARPILVFWLFIKTVICIMTFIFVLKARDIAQIVVRFSKPIAFPITQGINSVSLWSWGENFLGSLILGIFLALVFLVFFLILMYLVQSLSHRLKDIGFCFLFPSLRFFDPKVFYKIFLVIRFGLFYRLFATINALVHLL